LYFPLSDRFLPATERILLTLWVGGLWVAGFVVAPLLFAGLEDRAMAGTLAGTLFSVMSYVGLVCGVVLLVLDRVRSRVNPRMNWRLMVIVTMLLLVAVGEFVLTPMITELRQAGLVDSPRFGQLHGLAASLFIVTSVLGLVLVAAWSGD
jgi:hypothetical protein